MTNQLPPKVIDPNNKPMRYHALDPLNLAERTEADDRAVEGFLFAGVEPGSNVFLKYENKTFEYVVGDYWNTPYRYAGTVNAPERKGKHVDVS